LFTTTNNILLGKVLQQHDLVDSTNNQAKILLSKSKPVEGTVIIAHTQQQGKGQYGNNWETVGGQNLTFSIILYPKFVPASRQFLLSQAVALGIRDALEPYLPQPAYIKWPNDIISSDKKICGVLIENSLQGNILADSVIGIGVNVNQSDFDGLPHAASLHTLTGRNFYLDRVLHRILSCIEGYYLQLLARRETTVESTYLKHLYLLNKPATFIAEGNQFEGTIRGVDINGKILIEDSVGVKPYGLKEVSLSY
jgi:BirA family transcriptional regulator, biotin operon repressor / biotin---[acetyl-CoA-carboxylase] ligase